MTNDTAQQPHHASRLTGDNQDIESTFTDRLNSLIMPRTSQVEDNATPPP